MSTETRRWGTLNEAAVILGCSTRTVRRFIEDGALTKYRLGPRLIKVDLNELDALLVPISQGGVAQKI